MHTQKHTDETKKRISEKKKANPTRYWLGKKRSEETKRKISESKKGHSVKHMGQFRKYGKPWNKGLKYSDEQKELARIAVVTSPNFMAGEKHWNWKGGISKGYKYERNYKYKQWRKSVFDRDKYTCQDCGLVGVYLNAHHIMSHKNYKQLRYDVSNGITLCLHCHFVRHRKQKEG